jgi:CheY-like chemotaxis protein
VDDDRAYLDSLSRFLRRRGYDVSCHESARQALEALPKIRPELAIVDILMPVMDGLALTRRIHQDFKGEVPVVVLTGLPSKEAYHRARESGASYCLTKPCKPEDFLNIVDFIAGDLDQEERELVKNRIRESVGAAG